MMAYAMFEMNLLLKDSRKTLQGYNSDFPFMYQDAKALNGKHVTMTYRNVQGDICTDTGIFYSLTATSSRIEDTVIVRHERIQDS